MNPTISKQLTGALLGLAVLLSASAPAATLSPRAGVAGPAVKPINVGRGVPCGSVTLTQSTSQAITPLNSVSCNSGGIHDDNSYFRAFDLSAFPDGFNTCAVEFGVEEATAGAATQPIVVNVYSNTGGVFPAGTLTLQGTSTINLADTTAAIVNEALASNLPAGSQLVFEVFSPDGAAGGHSFFIGSNAGGQSAPSFIQAASCGLATPATTDSIGFGNMQIVMNVIGDPAGSNLTLGAVTSTDVCTAVPANNNTIIEPGEVVNFAIPLNATGGNFTNVSAVLTSATPGVTIVSGIGAYGTINSGGSASANYSISVADTVTCFSTLDLSLAVTSTEDNFTFPISRGVGQSATVTYNGLPLAIPDNVPTGASSTAIVSGVPGPITDVQVRVNAPHTWVGDLIFTLTSPTGTAITLLDQPGVPASTFGCSEENVAVTFQDGAADPENVCTVADPWPGFAFAAPVEALALLDGESANGTWTLTVSDNAAGDTGTLTDWELIILPAAVGTCSVCPSGADVAVTLTNTPDPVNAGAQITYIAVATNNGGSAATDMSVSLPLPAGVSLVSAAASGTGTCVGTVCTWTGTTANGASETATIVGLVAANTASGTVLSATATVDALENDPTAANDTATATATTGVLADVTVTLTDTPDPVTAGTNITYVATVANAGPSDAQGVTVALPAPTGTTLVSGTGVIGTIAGGSTGQATFVYAVSPAVLTGTVITATATATTTTPESNAANNAGSTTTTVVTEADLRLISLVPSATQTSVNSPVTFTATSQNFGPSDAQNVVVSIALSPDFRYTSHSAAGATCTTPQVGLSGTISCTWAGATAVNGTRVLTVTAFSNNTARNDVTANTSSPTPDPIANNNSGAVTVTVGFPFESIPSLDRNAMLLLGLLLAFAGLIAIRRQN